MINQIEDYIHLAKTLPTGVLITDSNMKIVFINDEAEMITGHRLDDVRGKPCRVLFGDDCMSLGSDCFLANPYDEYNANIKISTKNNESLIIHKEAKAIFNDDGVLIGGIELFSVDSDIENKYAHLKREYRIQEENLNRWRQLLEIGLDLTSSLSLHRVLLRIVNILKKQFKYENVVIVMPNEKDELEVWARIGSPDDEAFEDKSIKTNEGIIGKSYTSGKPILVNDVRKHKDYINANKNILSELAVPIIFHDKSIGVINAESSNINFFAEEDIRILTIISNFAAIAIHHTTLTKEIATAREQYKSLFNESSDPIFITDLSNTSFLDCNTRASEVYGYEREEFDEISPMMLLNITDSEGAIQEGAFSKTWEGIHLTKESKNFYVEMKSTLIDFKGDKAFLTIVRDISDRKMLEQQLKTLSETDELTGLYNRRYFIKNLTNEVERAARYEHPLSLAMIDVDKFKDYNDNRGHQAGDRLLESIGQLLHSAVRSTDMACRYGGDEFAIIFPHVDLEEAENISSRIQKDYLDLKYDNTSLSIGICSYKTNFSEEEFLDNADKALYHVKHNIGRGKIAIFDKIKQA